MISSLDFKDFFTEPRSYVLICFNEQTVQQIFGVGEKDSKKFLFFWHFIQFNPNTQKYELLKFTSNPEFFDDGKKLDVVGIHNKIKDIYFSWKEQFGVAFPDVVIRKRKGSASYIFGEPGQISLSIEEMEDLSKMSFVFSHELGHYFYSQNIQKTAEEELSNVSYWKYNKSSFFYLFFVAYNISYSIYMGLDSETTSWVRILIISLNFLMVSYLSYFEVASFLSYKKRLKNYTQEFYSDHFAQKFLGEKVTEEKADLVGEQFDFNVFSHPRGDWRLKSLEINQNSTFFNWVNPVAHRPEYFVRSSFYEVVEYWSIQKTKLLNKLKSFF